MGFEKIIVIGSPGAGKSKFARKLCSITGLPLHYLDMLWYKPDRTHVSREEFDEKLEEILDTAKWIIDGNYQRTLERRLQMCDTVFLLDYPLEQCLAGAEERVGVKREEMPWVEESFDDDFRQWIIDFPQIQLPQIYSLLFQYKQGRDIIILKSRAETEEYIESLMQP
ncbi:MAG: adenylate kinase [Ruminococcus sp.]|nr:adenylate kinase [Ruminococcus sp.]